MISTDTSTATGVLTSSTQTIALGFYFMANTDLVVTRTRSGVITTLTLDSDYSVTGANNESGGSITVTGQASGDVITIVRTVPYTQLVDLVPLTKLSETLLEQALDKSTMMAQQLRRDLDVLSSATIEEAPIDGTSYARKDAGWITLSGGGDMLKSVYDTDNDGKVDSAETADTATTAGTISGSITMSQVSDAGSAATKAVGTSSGTVAAGDDSRIVAGGTALQPTGNGSQLTGLNKTQVGLGNADNTSDANKPVSTAQAAAIALKQDASSALALGETSSTAYRGDRGKTAYDHSQLTASNPHGTTAEQVGAATAAQGTKADSAVQPATPVYTNQVAIWTNGPTRTIGGSSNCYFNTSTTRLGLGTDTPLYALHVVAYKLPAADPTGYPLTTAIRQRTSAVQGDTYAYSICYTPTVTEAHGVSTNGNVFYGSATSSSVELRVANTAVLTANSTSVTFPIPVLAPTAAVGTNTNQVATTSFTQNALALLPFPNMVANSGRFFTPTSADLLEHAPLTQVFAGTLSITAATATLHDSAAGINTSTFAVGTLVGIGNSTNSVNRIQANVQSVTSSDIVLTGDDITSLVNEVAGATITLYAYPFVIPSGWNPYYGTGKNVGAMTTWSGYGGQRIYPIPATTLLNLLTFMGENKVFGVGFNVMQATATWASDGHQLFYSNRAQAGLGKLGTRSWFMRVVSGTVSLKNAEASMLLSVDKAPNYTSYAANASYVITDNNWHYYRMVTAQSTPTNGVFTSVGAVVETALPWIVQGQLPAGSWHTQFIV